MSYNHHRMPNRDIASTPHTNSYGSAATSHHQLPSTTQTIAKSVRSKLSTLKTLVLKLKPGSHRADLSNLNSEQLDQFVDDMVGDLQSTFTNNINSLRAQVKSARPDPSDPQYAIKMQHYEELLKAMVPVIQRIQNLSGEILSELRSLMDRLWRDVCENNGKGIDRLLEDHAQAMEQRLQHTFFGPFSELEARLQQINSNQRP